MTSKSAHLAFNDYIEVYEKKAISRAFLDFGGVLLTVASSITGILYIQDNHFFKIFLVFGLVMSVTHTVKNFKIRQNLIKARRALNTLITSAQPIIAVQILGKAPNNADEIAFFRAAKTDATYNPFQWWSKGKAQEAIFPKDTFRTIIDVLDPWITRIEDEAVFVSVPAVAKFWTAEGKVALHSPEGNVVKMIREVMIKETEALLDLKITIGELNKVFKL